MFVADWWSPYRWRGTSLSVRLAQAAIRHCVALGLTWNYILVRPQMERFFTRMGYQRSGAIVDFSGVGPLIPLRLNLDPAYLRSRGSILNVDLRTQGEHPRLHAVLSPSGPKAEALSTRLANTGLS